MPDTKISDDSDAGTLDGTEIVPVVVGGANERTTTQAIADLGGGSGLWSGLITPPPLISGWTAYGTPVGADLSGGGIVLSDSGTSTFRGYYLTPPATPYTRSALLSSGPHVLASGNGPVFGLFFSDGTKFVRFHPAYAAGVFGLAVDYYSAPTTFVAFRKNQTASRLPDPMWLQIGDDGTNFTFSVSSNGGRTWTLFYSVAKASSDLSAGYSRIGFDLYDGGVANQGSLLSWG